MLFDNPDQFIGAPRHAVTMFGMSGVGKTRLSNLLRNSGWFHFSVDYRIGTRHMGEFIADNFKREAMKVQLLADLLRSDSVYISSNITFDNLEPLSTYLGAPGDPARGGLPLAEYQRRQEQHRLAEISALGDMPYFIERAKTLYGYDDFIADTGGSLIEVLDVNDPADPVIKTLIENSVLLHIKGTENDAAELVKRFRACPKPMYYRPALLIEQWQRFKAVNMITRDEEIDPAAFAIFGYKALMTDRAPRYQTLADRHGYTVAASDVATVRDGADFTALMQKAIAERVD
jgi:hypothetical protein